jgi:hypothetical protein
MAYIDSQFDNPLLDSILKNFENIKESLTIESLK